MTPCYLKTLNHNGFILETHACMHWLVIDFVFNIIHDQLSLIIIYYHGMNTLSCKILKPEALFVFNIALHGIFKQHCSTNETQLLKHTHARTHTYTLHPRAHTHSLQIKRSQEKNTPLHTFVRVLPCISVKAHFLMCILRQRRAQEARKTINEWEECLNCVCGAILKMTHTPLPSFHLMPSSQELCVTSQHFLGMCVCVRACVCVHPSIYTRMCVYACL